MKRYHYRPQDRHRAVEVKGTKKKLVIAAAVAVVVAGLAYASLGLHGEDEVGPNAQQFSLASSTPKDRSDLSLEQDHHLERVEGALFQPCGRKRVTCVVDGDTFWLNGTKIRVSDIDTPEVSQPKCVGEKELGDKATAQLVLLLNSGPFDLVRDGARDTDRFGRKLRRVIRDGVSIGDQLVAAGLARTWTGKREPWC